MSISLAHSFRAGDHVTVLADPGDGWCEVESAAGEKGLVPKNYLSFLVQSESLGGGAGEEAAVQTKAATTLQKYVRQVLAVKIVEYLFNQRDEAAAAAQAEADAAAMAEAREVNDASCSSPHNSSAFLSCSPRWFSVCRLPRPFSVSKTKQRF